MLDYQMQSRRSGKSEIIRMAVDFALKSGRKIAVATNDQARTASDLTQRTSADLCEISGDMFVIPHKRKGITSKRPSE